MLLLGSVEKVFVKSATYVDAMPAESVVAATVNLVIIGVTNEYNHCLY